MNCNDFATSNGNTARKRKYGARKLQRERNAAVSQPL
jgi:hypothetical protein